MNDEVDWVDRLLSAATVCVWVAIFVLAVVLPAVVLIGKVV